MSNSRPFRSIIRNQYGLRSPPYAEGERPDMTQTVAELGREDPGFATVHVTGTNGSGSTSHFLADSLVRAGYTVGQFSDIKVAEMGSRDFYRLDGTPITGDAMLSLADDVARKITTRDEWDFLVAMAIEYFSRHDVDIAVVEAGVGGRDDSTNVLYDDVSVITSVGLDHANHLGGTIESVTRHKAGIFDEGSVAVVNGPEEAQTVAREVAASVGATMYTPQAPVTFTREDGLTYTATYRGETVETELIAEFYCTNINTAVTALEVSPFDVDAGSIREAISTFQMPGRAELLHGEPDVLLDGAHNPHAAHALAETLASVNRPTTIVVDAIIKNDWKGILNELAPEADRLVVTTREGEDADDTLRQALPRSLDTPVRVESDPQQALAWATDTSSPNGLVVLTGSFAISNRLRPTLIETEPSPWIDIEP